MTRVIFFTLHDCLSSTAVLVAKSARFLGKTFCPRISYRNRSIRLVFVRFLASTSVKHRIFIWKASKQTHSKRKQPPESTPPWNIHQKWKTNYSDFRFGGRAFCAFVNWKSRVQGKVIINNAHWLGKVGISIHALPLRHFPTSIRGDKVVNQLSYLLRRDQRYWKGWKREWLSHYWFYESFEVMTDGFNVSATCARI